VPRGPTGGYAQRPRLPDAVNDRPGRSHGLQTYTHRACRLCQVLGVVFENGASTRAPNCRLDSIGFPDIRVVDLTRVEIFRYGGFRGQVESLGRGGQRPRATARRSRPSVVRTAIALSRRKEGLPCSRSRMNRSEVPDQSASSRWFSPSARRRALTSVPWPSMSPPNRHDGADLMRIQAFLGFWGSYRHEHAGYL
jgi:hypothetical protein